MTNHISETSTKKVFFEKMVFFHIYQFNTVPTYPNVDPSEYVTVNLSYDQNTKKCPNLLRSTLYYDVWSFFQFSFTIYLRP